MKDVVASTLARLKNQAKASNLSYQMCLQLFCQEEFLQIWYSIGGQKSTRGTSTCAFAQKRRCLEPLAPGYSFKRDPCARPELMPCTGRADRSSGPFGNNVSSGGHL